VSIKNKHVDIKGAIEDFDEVEREFVNSLLNSITLNHVMANSQTNLNQTRKAILQLSKGDLCVLNKLVDAAKLDFRDVIYLANLENEK